MLCPCNRDEKKFSAGIFPLTRMEKFSSSTQLLTAADVVQSVLAFTLDSHSTGDAVNFCSGPRHSSSWNGVARRERSRVA